MAIWKVMSPLPALAIYAKSLLTFPNFCTKTAVPSTTPPEKGVVTEFLLNKCSLTEEEISKSFKHCSRFLQSKSVSRFLQSKSVQNCEAVLELLNGCGLTTPAQIRKVTLYSPNLFFYRFEIIKPKFNFLRTFMKEEDITKLIYINARSIELSENRLKSAVLVLRKLGLEGEALSELVAREPRLFTALEKDVIESFKEVVDLGIKKGSKMFVHALRGILGLGKERLDRRRLGLSCLGFSEKQISVILRLRPMVLGLSEEKVKRNMDFLVNSVGLPLDDFVKYPMLFECSLEKNIIPRYRVTEALKSMKVLKTEMSFPRGVTLTEKCFMEKYVNSNAEFSSVLLDIYHVEKLKSYKLKSYKETYRKCDSVKTDPVNL